MSPQSRFSILLLLGGLALSAGQASAQSTICYAAPGGNDLNDGTYWAFAKADIMACYDALPPVGGTIYFKDDGSKTAAVHACKPSDPNGCGIWIMGHNDPNYAHPPAGWHRAKGTVAFLGVGSDFTSFTISPQVGISAGGNDENHPAIWLSDVQSHTFKNLKIYYGHNPIYIGIDSNGSWSPAEGVSSWNWLFENVSAQPLNRAGYGPAIKIATNSVWGFFRDCQFGGNPAEVATIDTLSRSSGTVTATAAANLPSSWVGTLSIGIIGASDGSFNGLFTATITGARTFTYPQLGPTAAALGGKASSDKAQVAVLNPGSGPGVGLISFENSFFSGGGVRMYNGSGSGVYVNTIFQENGFAPVVHVSGCPGGLGIRVSTIAPADQTTVVPGLRIDNTRGNCANGVVAQNTSVDGSAYLGGAAGPSNPLVLPDAMEQSGIYSGRVFAQTDTPRRAFGPVVARYANLANQLPSTWGVKGACQGVAGIPVQAPDGTMNAGAISIASGSTNSCFYLGKKNLSAGDWIVGGAWARSEKGNGFGRSPIRFSCTGCTLKNGASYTQAPFEPGGGGEWDWVSFVTQAESTGVYTLAFNGTADSQHPTDFFAPVLICLPGAAVSSNEAAEIALHLQSYRDDANVGQVSLLRGEQFKADSIQVGDGPIITSGLGPPKGAASVGSIYLRRDGAPGATFYIYEKNGWRAQF
jgi:hypothetical protein